MNDPISMQEIQSIYNLLENIKRLLIVYTFSWAKIEK